LDVIANQVDRQAWRKGRLLLKPEIVASGFDVVNVKSFEVHHTTFSRLTTRDRIQSSTSFRLV
ncbi:hypothetical protein, partial [Bradyrhizobium sp. CCBAU 45394]|uniref:hypothetical protein n=1 Tax=Bradyrhizobium sp. CCBAU 45394 TaxID=1325087 RepID=UPI0023034453